LADAVGSPNDAERLPSLAFPFPPLLSYYAASATHARSTKYVLRSWCASFPSSIAAFASYFVRRNNALIDPLYLFFLSLVILPVSLVKPARAGVPLACMFYMTFRPSFFFHFVCLRCAKRRNGGGGASITGRRSSSFSRKALEERRRRRRIKHRTDGPTGAALPSRRRPVRSPSLAPSLTIPIISASFFLLSFLLARTVRRIRLDRSLSGRPGGGRRRRQRGEPVTRRPVPPLLLRLPLNCRPGAAQRLVVTITNSLAAASSQH
jgi:hypothetical protein